jgi:radical SAM superfamily enzyme YgiQ (UPF0313 family)
MRILLLAMPDSASSLDGVMKFPNLGLCSLAAQAPGHDVRLLDLVLKPHKVLRRVLAEVADFEPDLVGYSAMSFQYDSARMLARAVRAAVPHALHVLGGYHATVLADAVAAHDGDLFDFIVRGEGEVAFRQLVEGLAGRSFAPETVPGLSFATAPAGTTTPTGPLLELDSVPLPRRDVRRLDGAFYFDRTFDVAEDEPGLSAAVHVLLDPQHVRRTFRRFPIPRVIADLKELDRRGRAAASSSSTTTSRSTCRASRTSATRSTPPGSRISSYIVQASVHGIAKDARTAEKMARAGFDTVFMGIENAEAANVGALDIKGQARQGRRRDAACGSLAAGERHQGRRRLHRRQSRTTTARPSRARSATPATSASTSRSCSVSRPTRAPRCASSSWPRGS